MKSFARLTFLTLLSAILLVACNSGGNTVSDGGSGGSSSSGSSSQSGNNGTSSTSSLHAGALSNGNFTEGKIAVGQSKLSAGGQTSLQVDLVDDRGQLVSAQSSVAFNSPCISDGSSKIDESQPIATTTGSVTATYIAQGCEGQDPVTATVTSGSDSATATANIQVQTAEIGSIQFVSAQPNVISLKGTGGTETSTVIFKVVDKNGNPVKDQTVQFTKSTSVGGLSLSRQSGQTRSDGTVNTVVNAGTVATSVRITAKTTDPSTGTPYGTQSNSLAISTGVPDENSFSLSVATHNIEAWEKDGVTDIVTIHAADRYNNPVPDGTTISFTTEGGSIDPSCQTTKGTCSVTWTSQAPRPSDGRVTILATALGEESFTDENGNGLFDDNEPFDDIQEAFENDDESTNPAYTSGEYFLDKNKNGQHDGPDGVFNGVLCDLTSYDDNPRPRPSKCAKTGKTSVYVFDQQILTMSDGAPDTGDLQPNLGGSSSQLDLTPDSIARVTFVLRDARQNPLPQGTTISVASTLGTVLDPSSYTVEDGTKSDASSNTYSFSVQGPTTSQQTSGLLTLTVTSPSGKKTTQQYPVTFTGPST